MFSDKDLKQIEQKSQNLDQINQQINRFKEGYPPLKIVKAATVGKGIKSFKEKKLCQLVEYYDKNSKRLKKLKFVPASGAASRMFKDLYTVISDFKGTQEEYLKLMEKRGFGSMYYLCKNIHNLALFNDLQEVLREKNTSFEEISKKKDVLAMFSSILSQDGLNYGNLPKGLLKFHKAERCEKTPVEEHLIEGALYASSGKKVNLHFTVSENHVKLFQAHLATVREQYEKKYKVKFNVEFSIQKPNTDTLAVDLNNEPFRTDEKELVFRPGGHGALIQNLNDIDADLVFVKNIDNVIQDRLKSDTILCKKALAGLLIQIRNETFDWIKKMSKKNATKYLNEVECFLAKSLFVKLPEGFHNESDERKVELVLSKLNRPIRVCGMVRNEGEPGGGPFWVENSDGTVALQIVESSQIEDDKKDLIKKATHFNPVDLVCSITNYKGKKFDLNEYVDEDTGFISQKSYLGRDLKALELPGLWNGAMSNWNTIFVEVPVTTFSPVKTISDLLKTEHMYEKDLLQGNDQGDTLVI